MTDKVRKAYSRLNIKTRITMIVLVILLTLMVMVFVATAGSGISFSGHTPAGGSVFSAGPELVSVDIDVYEGSLTEHDIDMSLNGASVYPFLESIEGGYRLSYMPEALDDGEITVFVGVYDTMKGTYETTDWSFTVDAAPNVLEQFPAADATLNISNPTVTLRVRDTYDRLNATSVTATLNGNPVATTFKYQGYELYDSCNNITSWIVTDDKEGTISFNTSVLENGTYAVEVSIADIHGNVLVETWTFEVASEVKFSNFTPGNNTVTGLSRPTISVSAVDGTIDMDRIEMLLDGENVSDDIIITTIDNGYTISYTPESNLLDKQYTATVRMFDTYKGIYESASWNFTVDAAPKPSQWKPANGSTLNTFNPTISLFVTDAFNNLDATSVSAKINGEPVGATFAYNSEYDSCSNVITYLYNQGTISLSPPMLGNGTHTVEVSIADVQGNVLVETWSFHIASEVKFSNFTPVNNTVIDSLKPTISVRAVDGTIDMERIEMLLDGEDVTEYSTITPISNGFTISYTPSSNLLEKQYTATVRMFDTFKGVYESTSWKFTVDAIPKPSQWKPVKGSTLAISNAAISLYVTDTFNNLDDTSVSAKINGEPVDATFAFETVFDSCTGVITAVKYKEGTIEFNTSGLQDGIQNVEVSIADVVGNVMTETWSFNVAELPVISNMLPADGSELTSASQVSAVVTDNTEVDPSSVKLFVNNIVVPHNFDETTGIVTYDDDFTTGNYNVRLEAKDLMGNRATANWSFVVSATPPTLTKALYLTNDMTITNGMLRLHTQLDSNVEIKDNVTLTLNGEPLDFDFRYQGYVDACSGDHIYVVTSTKTAFADYNKQVPDGDFTLVLTAEDKFGNSTSWTWMFTVRTLPTITNVSPFKYGLQELQPTISATVKDNDSFESIVLEFNGVVVDADYDPVTGKLTYTPPVPLENESNHTVSLTATDRIGLTATKTWGFNINTYPDMLDSNVSLCLPCHEKKSNRPPYEAVHRDFLYWGHDGNQDCVSCHNYVTSLDLCGDCHNSSSELYHASNWPPHGFNPDKKYSPANADSTYPLRVTTNRENWDCIICHQPGVGTQYKLSGWNNYRPLNNHDIPQLHAAPLTPDNESCTGCHARSLTREHAREGREDLAGQSITCLTCHQSVNTQVQSAIEAKDTSCTACHDINSTTGHAEMHVVSLGEQCVTCHGNNMMSEQVYHNNDCSGCHNSTNSRVQSAIQLQNRTCFGCHDRPHQVLMTVARDDIPKYDGVAWSTPDTAVVWAGEGWLPEELNNEMALVLFSAVVSLDKSVVSSFYKSEMVRLGWVLVEESEDNGGFSLLYRKSRRYCLIRYVQTAGGGYRLTIAYN